MAAKKTFEFFLRPLLKKFFQDMGRDPNNLEMLLIRQQAGKLLKDSNKIIPFKQKRSFAEEIEAMKKSGDIVDTDNMIISDKITEREMFKKANEKFNKPTIEGQMDKITGASNRIKEIQKEIDEMYRPKTDAEIKAKYDKENKESIQRFKDKMKKDEPEDKADGGRIGFRAGKFVLDKLIGTLLKDKNKMKQAADDIFPTGDYKMDAQLAAEALVENNPKIFGNKLYDDLDTRTQIEVYGAVLEPIQKKMALIRQLKKISRPEKTLESMKKGEGIDMSNPDIADEFARFMKETDPQGSKTIEQTVEITNFDPKGRKKNAKGGRAGFYTGGYGKDAAKYIKEIETDMHKGYQYYKRHGGKKSFNDYVRLSMNKYFADGGRAGYYTGGITDVKPSLDDIGHGSDALMARTRLMSPGSQATTSTGLNYLLAEDNDNIRVPFRVGKTAKKKKKKRSPNFLEMMMMMPELTFREPINFPYKSLEDIPPNVLAMLRKDPNFDLETFLTKVGWSDPDKTRIQTKLKGGDEAWGLYSPMSDTSFLNYQQFGKNEPMAGGLMSIKSPTDADKVQTILHEMRHGKMKEPWFMQSSAVPEWVRKYEMAGAPHYLDADIKDKFEKFRDTQQDVSGEELYVRFMDQYFGDVAEKGTIAGSDYKPYFDKILKDEWTPYAKRYEKILKEEKRVKDKPYGLAEGGRIGFSTGKLAGGIGSAIAKNKKLEEDIDLQKRMIDMLNKRYEDRAHGKHMTPMPVPMEDVMKLDRPSKPEIEVGPYSPEAGSGDFGAEDIYAVFDDGTIYYKDTGEFYDNNGNQVDGPSPGAKLKVPTMEAAEGGRIGFAGGTDPRRRAFLKLLAALTGGVTAFKSGLLSLGGKGATKQTAKEIVKQSAGSGTPPPYFFKLVDKIQTFGDDVTKKYATQERQKVTKYKDFELTEDLATGEQTIQKIKISDDGPQFYDETLAEDTYMNYKPGAGQADEGTKGIPADEYMEDTGYLRTTGPQKGELYDSMDGLTDDTLKEILEEVGETVIKKADGGRIGFSGGNIAKLLAGKSVTGSSRKFLEKVFGKERFANMIENDPELHRGLLEVVEMFRKKDKEGLKMYMQKFLPHMDDETIEDFIIGGGGTEGIQGQLLRLGSGRDYAGKLEMMKRADNMRKLDTLDITEEMIRKPNASGGRIGFSGGGIFRAIIAKAAASKGMKPYEFIKVTSYKSLPPEVKMFLSADDFAKLKSGQEQMYTNYIDMAKTRKNFQDHIEGGKNTPARELFEGMEKTMDKQSYVPKNVTLDDIAEMELMVKNRFNKGRKDNAQGGIQTMLGE